MLTLRKYAKPEIYFWIRTCHFSPLTGISETDLIPISIWNCNFSDFWKCHCRDVIMGTMASKITSLQIFYSTVYSGADERKHQSSTSLAFVKEIHRLPVNSPHKGPVMRKMFPFDDIIICIQFHASYTSIVYCTAPLAPDDFQICTISLSDNDIFIYDSSYSLIFILDQLNTQNAEISLFPIKSG